MTEQRDAVGLRQALILALGLTMVLVGAAGLAGLIR